jgi:uridine kinase
MNNCLFVGVAGGSGSGKTTVAHNLIKAFNHEDAVLIEQDAYYRELRNTTIEQRAKINFDHPDSIEFELIKEHLVSLKNNKTINRPIYDFKTHLRKEKTVTIQPSKIVIIEGILILAMPEIREMLDMKIFVDTDTDEMLLRRIQRDIEERDRTFDCVKKQYLETVKPMYLEFCEPSKRYADVIIPRGGENKIAVNMIIAKLKRYLVKGSLN